MSVLKPITDNPRKFKLYLTPEEFGARGDGVTDDTQAIQKALDQGATVVLRRFYKITSPVNIGTSILTGTGPESSGLLLSQEGKLLIHSSFAGVEKIKINTLSDWSADAAIRIAPIGRHQVSPFIRDVLIIGDIHRGAAVALGGGAYVLGLMNVLLENIKVHNFEEGLLLDATSSWMSGGTIRNFWIGACNYGIKGIGSTFYPSRTTFENIHGEYSSAYSTALIWDFSGKQCLFLNPMLWDGGVFAKFTTYSRHNLIVGGHGPGNKPESFLDYGYKNTVVESYPAYGSTWRSRLFNHTEKFLSYEEKFYSHGGSGYHAYSLGLTPPPKLPSFILSAGEKLGEGTSTAYTYRWIAPYTFTQFRQRFRFIDDVSNISNFFTGLDDGNTPDSLSSAYIGIFLGEDGYFWLRVKSSSYTINQQIKRADNSWHEVQISIFDTTALVVYFDGNLVGLWEDASLPRVDMRVFNLISSSGATQVRVALADLYLRGDLRLS